MSVLINLGKQQTGLARNKISYSNSVLKARLKFKEWIDLC